MPQPVEQFESARPPLTAADMISMQRVGAPVPSHDGTHIVTTVSSLLHPQLPYHESDNATWTTSLWIIRVGPADSKIPSEKRRLTYSPGKKDYNPVWLDHVTIAFLSNRSGSPQVWTMRIDGGEPLQLSHYPLPVSNLQYNAVRGLMLFTAEVYPTIKEGNILQLTQQKDQQQQAANSKTNYQVYDKLFVRRWDTWQSEKRSHIFLQRLSPPSSASAAAASSSSSCSASSSLGYSLVGEPVDALAGLDIDSPVPPFGEVSDFCLSPDGSLLVYAALNNKDSSIAWTTNSDLFAVAIATPSASASSASASSISCGVPTQVNPPNPGYDNQPVFSRNGRYLCWLSMARGQFEADKRRLMLRDMESGQVKELMPNFDYSINEFFFTPDNKIVFSVDYYAHTSIFQLQSFEDSSPVPLITKHTNSSLALLDGKRMVFAQDSFHSPAELFVSDLSGINPQPLCAPFNSPKLSRFSLASAVEFYFPGADNTKVHAWLMPPTHFQQNPHVKYPLAVVIHGGPQGVTSDHWHYRWNPQILAAQGFAVLMINFHGSTSFGQSFTDAITGDWGGKPFEDIMKGVDYTLNHNSWIDANKMAALGASYGGYMINWINGHTNRFKCLVNHDGIFNLEAMYYSTEEVFFPEWEMKGPAFSHPELYAKWSPHKFVQNWQTPTLVIHGGKDYRVVDTEGLSTFTALQRRGVPSRLLHFPEENHWVLNHANSVVWHREVVAWLNRWLQ